jgi:hypothetical protein
MSATDVAARVPASLPVEILRVRAWHILLGLWALASAYHFAQSLGHVTPSIFTDELLYQKLSQSLAAGDGLTVRGSDVMFPAFLPALVQAPAWLVHDVPIAYGLAKALNAAVMTSALFPAYWLARQLVREAWAILAAGLVAASPAVVYHSYLGSEALAYPVFFLALAVMTRELAAPSFARGLGVIGVSLLAVTTRAQFAALPLAYCLSVAFLGRRQLRAHAVPLAGLLALGFVGAIGGARALGPYAGAALFDYDPRSVVHWLGVVTMLLPWAAGLVVVPGGLMGLGCAIARPRALAERAFGLLAVTVGAATLLEVALVGAADAETVLERYAIYLPPLIGIAFLSYAERGGPNRRVHAALALAIGFGAVLVPLGSFTVVRFTYSSPTLSIFGELATRMGQANATCVFAGAAVCAGLVAAAVPLRGRAPAMLAAGAVAVLALASTAAYASDRATTRSISRYYGASPSDWLDRARLGHADYLELRGGSPEYGWNVEVWNRSFGRLIRLGTKAPRVDAFADSEGLVSENGLLLVDGRPMQAGILVVNSVGTAIGLEGKVVARPRPGISAVRVPAGPHVRWLAEGMYPDGWASAEVRYRVWPSRPAPAGAYRLHLELPSGRHARTIRLAVLGGRARLIHLHPGQSVGVMLRTSGLPIPELRITADRTDFDSKSAAGGRLVAVRVTALRWARRG